MCTTRSMADVDFGDDIELGGIAGAKSFSKSRGLSLLDKVDGTTSEAAAGKASANEPGQILGQSDHGVSFDTTSFKILAVTCMRLSHQAANFSHFAT